MPLSKVKRGLAEVLKREGYIWDWREESEEARRASSFAIELKYGPNGERVIRHIRRVSKPGRRVYSRADRPAARAQRPGNFDHQHQPRRDQRPRSPAAKPRRRSAVRSVVRRSVVSCQPSTAGH